MDQAWDKEHKLVIGIDIGTTCSAVSYVHLTRGTKPEIQHVTEWPGQSGNDRQCKLPSWVWYDSDHKPVKYGAEAFHQDAEEALEQGCRLAKYFKLHLHPIDMAPSSGFQLDTLPAGVTVGQVYTNYLRYLFQHTQSFFGEHVFRGQNVWQSLLPSMEIIMAHPNGWGTREQGVLRTAAVAAGLSTLSDSHRRISFVSEAEASIQYCLTSSQTSSLLLPGMNLVVCDAGGSTVDTTVYTVTAVEPMLELEEMKSSACIQAGAIFVDNAVESYLRERLVSAGLDDDDVDAYTKDGLDHFTNFSKPNFSGTEDLLDIKVGKRRLNLPSISVQGGRMKLTGSKVKAFFDVCVELLGNPIAGGFGDSPYLKATVRRHFGGQLTTNNSPGAKAVADGAAIWAVTRSVVSRATRYSYGIETTIPYDAWDPEHVGRRKTYSASGHYRVSHAWSEIVGRNTVMSYDSSLKQPHYYEYYTASQAPSRISVTLFTTTLPSSTRFMCDKNGVGYEGWTPVCKVSADLQDLETILVQKSSSITGSY